MFKDLVLKLRIVVLHNDATLTRSFGGTGTGDKSTNNSASLRLVLVELDANTRPGRESIGNVLTEDGDVSLETEYIQKVIKWRSR